MTFWEEVRINRGNKIVVVFIYCPIMLLQINRSEVIYALSLTLYGGHSERVLRRGLYQRQKQSKVAAQ